MMRVRSGSVLVSGSASVIEATGGGVSDHVAAGSAAIDDYDVPAHCHHGCHCASRAQPNGGKPTPLSPRVLDVLPVRIRR